MPENTLSFETWGVDLPYNIDAERAVLGSIILDQHVLFEVEPLLQPEYFYSSSNGEIYRIMNLLSTSGKPVDLVTVLEEVCNLGIFPDDQQAKVYLYQIFETAPKVANAASYATIVADKYIQRSLLYAARDIISTTSESSEPTDTLIDFAEQRIYAIRKGKSRRELVRISDAVVEEIEYLNKITGPNKEDYLGLKTGFKYIDNKLSGLNRSDLIILAARPSVGKSSLALNIATNIVKNYPKVDVAFFSLEMSNRQLAERLVCTEAEINMGTLRFNTLADEDWRAIVKASKMITPMNLYLDDTSMITINEIKGKCRRLDNLGLIVVDYLQLMSSGRRIDNRVAEITELTRNFKIMAKELDVPILLLSQLSRESERSKRRPMLSDLRDSGSIEQDADIVMFLHRYSKEELEQSNSNIEYECIIAKNRHGSVGEVPLKFEGEYTKFSSMELEREAY